MKKIFTSILIKKGDKLVHTLDAKEQLYKEYVKSLPEDTKVDIFMDVSGSKGSKAQLAKIHAMIRQLADDVGEDTMSMKAQVKERAGIDKSFADCDKHELSSVIQVILTMGDFLGSNLRD
tara:strand:+ start:366 stop:725 length:360 start_codon:yes stop_codon:yes gene_type:complete